MFIVRETSRLAYHKIKENGLLSKRRFEFFECLVNVEPATGGEVFREFKRIFGAMTPTNSNATTRLRELEKMGVVEEVGTRVCTVSKQEVILWQATGKLPRPLPKVKKIPCEHCGGRGHFLEPQMSLELN